jgi:hypothetical protein
MCVKFHKFVLGGIFNGFLSVLLNGLSAYIILEAPLDSMPGIETKSLQLWFDFVEIGTDFMVGIVYPGGELVEVH